MFATIMGCTAVHNETPFSYDFPSEVIITNIYVFFLIFSNFLGFFCFSHQKYVLQNINGFISLENIHNSISDKNQDHLFNV